MNLPNKITFARIFLTVLFVVLLLTPGPQAKIGAFILFTLAAVSDYLDGRIAKKHDLMSDLGRIMDPVADKVLTLSAFFVFSIMGVVPFIFSILIALREITITTFRLVLLTRGKVVPAFKTGKQKTVLQMFAIFFTLVFIFLNETEPGNVFFWSTDIREWYKNAVVMVMGVTAMFTLLSGISFFLEYRKGIGRK